jgi:uncharacterized protein (DUF302 family)
VTSMQDTGLAQLSSPYSVAGTVARLEALLQKQALTMFCRIDYSGEAEKAGLKIRPPRLAIFGSPKAGTPLMIAPPCSRSICR